MRLRLQRGWHFNFIGFLRPGMLGLLCTTSARGAYTSISLSSVPRTASNGCSNGLIPPFRVSSPTTARMWSDSSLSACRVGDPFGMGGFSWARPVKTAHFYFIPFRIYPWLGQEAAYSRGLFSRSSVRLSRFSNRQEIESFPPSPAQAGSAPTARWLAAPFASSSVVVRVEHTV